jgi:hypothetical protein
MLHVSAFLGPWERLIALSLENMTLYNDSLGVSSFTTLPPSENMKRKYEFYDYFADFDA